VRGEPERRTLSSLAWLALAASLGVLALAVVGAGLIGSAFTPIACAAAAATAAIAIRAAAPDLAIERVLAVAVTTLVVHGLLARRFARGPLASQASAAGRT